MWAFTLAYVSAGRSPGTGRPAGTRRRRERPPDAHRRGRPRRRARRQALQRQPRARFRPAAFLDKEPLVDTFDELGVPVVGASWDLDEVISRFKIAQVVVTFSTAPDEVLLRIVRRCEDLGIPTAIVPRLFERMPALTQMEHLGGLPLVAPKAAEPTGWQFRVKYAFDRVLSGSPFSFCLRSSSRPPSPCSCRWDGPFLPPGAHRSRRAPFRDAQVPLDGRRPGDEADGAGRGSWARWGGGS